MVTMMPSLLPYLMAAASAILAGANFNLSKPVLADLHPMVAGAGRFGLAAMVLIAMGVARGPGPDWRRHGMAYGVLGTVGVGGFNLLFLSGMQDTSAVNGALIMATNPLLTTVLAAMVLGERISSRQMLALPVALIGVSVVVLGGGVHLGINRGDALMVGADVCWAAYNVLTRKMLSPGRGVGHVTGIVTVGALVQAAAAVVVGAPIAMPGPNASMALVAMALGGTVLVFLFWNEALARLGAGRTVAFMNFVPVSAMVISAFSGAMPTVTQLAGGALVILAVSVAVVPLRMGGHGVAAKRPA